MPRVSVTVLLAMVTAVGVWAVPAIFTVKALAAGVEWMSSASLYFRVSVAPSTAALENSGGVRSIA